MINHSETLRRAQTIGIPAEKIADFFQTMDAFTFEQGKLPLTEEEIGKCLVAFWAGGKEKQIQLLALFAVQYMLNSQLKQLDYLKKACSSYYLRSPQDIARRVEELKHLLNFETILNQNGWIEFDLILERVRQVVLGLHQLVKLKEEKQTDTSITFSTYVNEVIASLVDAQSWLENVKSQIPALR